MASSITHPYTIKMWYPSYAAEADATLVLTMKAPELPEQITKSRNQVIQRTRAGTVYVYDRGQSLNDLLSLKFIEVPDTERAAFVTFLETIQYGSTKFLYQDVLGVQRIVRLSAPSVRYQANLPILRDGQPAAYQVPTWNFNIDLLDLSNSIADVEGTDAPVPTQIALHIANLNDPHNPAAVSTVVDTDGTKTLESVKVDDFDGIIWSGLAMQDGRKRLFVICATHDGFSATDATGADKTESIGGEIGSVLGLTFSVDVSGTGASQYINLKVSTTETSAVTIKIKRMKF